mmetsp:Transcript_10830/g.20063  ORF Transcript_10830/g.20063 Transcript_10830/m.20063 type:complete len:494 (-) Transcript_10830:105-1586(-)
MLGALRRRTSSLKRHSRQISGLGGSASDSLRRNLGAFLPPECFVDDEDLVAPYREDWLGQFGAPAPTENTPRFVVRPGSPEEVAEMLQFCNANKVPVVPQGGNTGLVGGSVPCRGDELVLSTSRLNKILSFDHDGGSITCQSGCVLDDLNAYAKARGYIMPLDLGSSGSCQIGGNIATHAGGIRLVRYGPLRTHVLGLQVVLADGTILDSMSSLRKDNTGYDLKQLFIGSEGTLGVITAAAISTPPAPTSTKVALLGVSSFEEVISVLRSAKSSLGEVLSAIEYWDNGAMNLVTEQCPDTVPMNPLGTDASFYVLIETSGSNESHDEEKLFQFLEPYSLGTIATDLSQATSLWAVREHIPVALKQAGHTFKYDVSMPSALLDTATKTVARHLKEKGGACADVKVYQYGHVGDGNLHFNVLASGPDASIKQAIEESLYPYLASVRGSISAEHGIGVLKAKSLVGAKSHEEMAWMRRLKASFDPVGILNPGKVLL